MKTYVLRGFVVLVLVAVGVLTYRRESYRIEYPERIGYEKYHRYRFYGVPLYETKVGEDFPYDNEYRMVVGKAIELAEPLKREPDYIKSVLGSMHIDYGYSWVFRQRRELIEAIYLRYRESGDLVDAKEKLVGVNSVLPSDEAPLADGVYESIEELRVSLGLKHYLPETEQDVVSDTD